MPGRGRESVSDFGKTASKEKAANEVVQKLGNVNAFDLLQANRTIRSTQTWNPFAKPVLRVRAMAETDVVLARVRSMRSWLTSVHGNNPEPGAKDTGTTSGIGYLHQTRSWLPLT